MHFDSEVRTAVPDLPGKKDAPTPAAEDAKHRDRDGEVEEEPQQGRHGDFLAAALAPVVEPRKVVQVLKEMKFEGTLLQIRGCLLVLLIIIAHILYSRPCQFTKGCLS